MRLPRPLQLLLLAVVATVLTVGFPGFSSAAFTARTQATGTVQAAVDWTPPTVAVVSPGTVVKDTVTIGVTATDGETGIASVTLEQLAPGAAGWVTVCTDTTAPYSCAWKTLPLADGDFSLRARATDNAGYEATSVPVRTTVANTLLIVLASPGDVVRGTVPLVTSVDNAGAVSHTVRVEYAPTGTTAWKTICSALTSPYTCSWNTTGLAADDYDLRSVLTAGPTTTISDLVEGVAVDNASPSVTMIDPGTPLSGSRTFAATAADVDSGVDRVVIQHLRSGTSTWQTLCTIVDEPWTCRGATSTLLDGTYSFRAVATDVAGNSTTSAVVANRVVDNTVSSISVDVPSPLTGTVTVAATAASTAGVASVRIQVAPTGSSTWTDLCTDTSSPYSCTWDTTTVANGSYSVRGILVDGKGASLTSAVVGAQQVENSPLRGADVQSLNGGTTSGRADSGDTITLTYSGRVDLTKVVGGWNGASTGVTARFRDGALLGKSTTDDTLDVLAGTSPVNLGAVNLRRNYVSNNATATFNATMTAGTVTVGGVVRTTITVRLGTVVSGSTSLRTATTSGALIWTPSAAVTDLQGRPCSTTPVTESGTADRDL